MAGFNAGDIVDEGRLERAVAEMEMGLMNHGYLNARVTVDTFTGPEGFMVRFVVNPGKLARIARWELTAEDTVADRPVVRLLPRTGTAFSKLSLERSASRVLAFCEQNGFPLAEVRPLGLTDSAGWVIPVLEVNPGPRVVVGRLEFSGAHGLTPGLASRLARFRAGLSYSSGLVWYWRRNLQKSRVVRVLGHEVVEGDGYGVRFLVSPLRSNRALAAAGYSAGDRMFTGTVEFEFGNILNTGRRLEGSWRAFKGRGSWLLTYVEPWILVPWLSLEGTVRHDAYDTSGSRTSLSAQARIATETGFEVRLSSGYDLVAATDTNLRSSTTWAGTGLALDTREKELNPRRGAALDLRTTGGSRAAQGKTGFVGRFEADAALAGPALGSLVFANSGHYRLVYSSARLSDLELYRVGGARTLRGYREDEFSARQVGWFNCELGWQIAANAVGYPFGDAGVCQTLSGWVFAIGYGFGLRVSTRIGLFEVDYGVMYKDSPVRGKVHLSFEAEF